MLGEVYEYFLGQFATAEGKKGGQFYTPSSVVKTLVAVLSPYKGRIYDPCCGSGGMFVQSQDFIKSHASGPIINSELSSYQIITNSSVSSIIKMDNHQHLGEEDSLDNNEVWSMDYGSFHLSVNNEASEILSDNVLSTSPSNASLNLGSKSNPDALIIVLAKSKIVIDELVPTLKNECLMLLVIERIFAFTTSLT